MIAVPDATLVAQRPAADAALELGDELRREAVREHRERPIEHEAHHLPVAGDRVLAGRGLRHPPEGPDAALGIERSPTVEDDAVETEATQVGNAERNRRGDVAEGVAALIAVRGRVRQLADADAVEHDQDDAVRARGGVLNQASWSRK